VALDGLPTSLTYVQFCTEPKTGNRHTDLCRRVFRPSSHSPVGPESGRYYRLLFWLSRFNQINAEPNGYASDYCQMSKKLPREDIHSEMLLALAGYWRNCAVQSDEPWRVDMMRSTAEEFEKAAARATRQAPETP
jgi:hypothetical protein